jgi:rRNA maturation endonuclease Nob1
MSLVKPIVEVRTRRSQRYCGACGKIISLTDTVCKSCGEEIDWSIYPVYRTFSRKERKANGKVSV